MTFDDAVVATAGVLITGGVGMAVFQLRCLVQEIKFLGLAVTRIEGRLETGEKMFESHGDQIRDHEARLRALEKRP